MYDYDRRGGGGGVFSAFLLGGIVGAVLGLLFAPRSGKETRDMLQEKGQEYLDEGKQMYETGREKVTSVVESGREMVPEKTAELRTKIEETRERLKEQVGQASQAARERIGQTTKATESALDKRADKAQEKVDTAESKTTQPKQGSMDVSIEDLGNDPIV